MTRFTAVALFLLSLATFARADDTTAFARIIENEQGQPRALQVAIASYSLKSGFRQIRVDLVGAIHIGDQAYYLDLNERFKTYDTALYELIAPKDTIVERDGSHPKGFISNAQIAMKNMLDLSFQLDEVDYGARNFVHADLSPEELSQSMDERGESLYVYFWRLFYAAMNQYAKDPLGLQDVKKLSATLASGSDNSFKVLIAYELVNAENYEEILGVDADSAVIGARNQRAIDVLREQIESGKTNVAVFYGVAHMPDMEQRLMEQLGFAYLGTTWVDAWNLDGQAGR